MPDPLQDVQRFAFDPAIARWAEAANIAATDVLADPTQAHQYRYQDTWFVGVDALSNAADGSIGGVPLRGAVIDKLKHQDWHAAQLSVTYPGYPQPMAGESDGQHRFRIKRAAAHVDGLLPVGPDRRRKLIEPHAFILGLPLNDCAESPLVVWDGSAEIMRAAFAEALMPIPPSDWADVDLTETYQAARRQCFEQCPRVTVQARPGEAILVHRLSLHGVMPWEGLKPFPEGRRIAYFRPLLEDPADWLTTSSLLS